MSVVVERPWDRRTRAIAQLTASAILFGIMAFFTRRATLAGASPAQVSLLRFVVALGACGTAVASGRVKLAFRRWDLLAMRAGFGAAAAFIYFVTLAHLPAGTTTLLQYSSPIWSTLFAAMALSERPTRLMVVALVVASLGVVLVVVGQGRALGGEVTWLLVGVGSAVLSGVAMVAIRAARRYNSAWSVFTIFSLAGALIPLPWAIAGWHPLSPLAWSYVVVVGGTALAAQMLMTHALGVADNATAGALSQLTVVVAMGLGAVMKDEVLTWISATGAVITVLGTVLVARERRPPLAGAPPPEP